MCVYSFEERWSYSLYAQFMECMLYMILWMSHASMWAAAAAEIQYLCLNGLKHYVQRQEILYNDWIYINYLSCLCLCDLADLYDLIVANFLGYWRRLSAPWSCRNYLPKRSWIHQYSFIFALCFFINCWNNLVCVYIYNSRGKRYFC